MPHSTERPLAVNDGDLEPFEIAPLKPSDPFNLPLKELRRRYREDGYLFLKGIIPRQDVLRARAEYFEYLAPSGVLKPGTEPVEGIFDDKKDIKLFPGIGAGESGGNTTPAKETTEFMRRALDAHGQDWYAEKFCKHPALIEFIKQFTGWSSNTHPLRRTLLRNNIPNTKPIGVHYDQIFLRHGEPTSVAVWVPIGDISLHGGGLIYLEDGHSLGKEIEDAFNERAKATGLSENEAKSAFNPNMFANGLLSNNPAAFARKYNRRWLVSAYEAGDAVLHTPFTIHASTINRDLDNIIRLATDLRFVDSSKAWDERWANTYRVGDGV